jgi:NAD(P)-dependent dehydrogenase (short-subunit alcohol dehydrogenase family)
LAGFIPSFATCFIQEKIEANKMSYFTGKTAIVTGGGSGIGKALCEGLAAQGCIVVVADLDLLKAQEIAARINGTGGKAEALQVDVSQAEQVQGIVDETVSRYGKLDLMFNNAGIGIYGEVRDMTLEYWNRIIDVNLKGVVHGIAAAYPVMLRQGFGQIVNTSSGHGLVPLPTHAAYGATKHGIVGLSLSMRPEAEGLGVKVNVACPFLINTPMTKNTTYLGVSGMEALGKPPFRMLEAEECAGAILKGVERNKAIILDSFLMKLTWWLYRINPVLLKRLANQTINNFRKVRNPELLKELLKKQ